MNDAIKVVVEVKDGMVVGVYSTDTNVSVEIFDRDILEDEVSPEELLEQEDALASRVQSGELHNVLC